MTSSGCSMEGALPKKETVPTVLQSRFLGGGCDETLFSEKKGFSVKRGKAIH